MFAVTSIIVVTFPFLISEIGFILILFGHHIQKIFIWCLSGLKFCQLYQIYQIYQMNMNAVTQVTVCDLDIKFSAQTSCVTWTSSVAQ